MATSIMKLEVSNTGQVDLVVEGIQGFCHRVNISHIIDDEPVEGIYHVSSIHIEDGRITLEAE